MAGKIFLVGFHMQAAGTRPVRQLLRESLQVKPIFFGDDMSKTLRNMLNWSLSQDLTAPQKLTLVVFVDHANQQLESHPCLKQITERTGLDRKTVVFAIRDLRDFGLLIDTEKRIGRTKQVIVYSLPIESQKRNCLRGPFAKPLSSVKRVPKTDHGSSCSHRQKKPLAKKAKFAPSLRLVVGGE